MKYEQQLIVQNHLWGQVNQVKWKQWGPVKGKDKHGYLTTHIKLLSKSGSVVKLLKLYTKQLQKMSHHQLFKLWQLRNFNMILENIQPGQVMFVHDFQQNLLLLTPRWGLSFTLGPFPVDNPSNLHVLPWSYMSKACERRHHPHINGQESW